jgi:hypothetical protein
LWRLRPVAAYPSYSHVRDSRPSPSCPNRSNAISATYSVRSGSLGRCGPRGWPSEL